MARVVSIFLPTWSTDRFRRGLGLQAPSADQPVVLVGRDGPRKVVRAADAAAWRLGLRPGMPASKAQMLAPGLLVHDANPAADQEALERLSLWALQFAPIVCADPPDGLIIDTTGAAHLHGGEEDMLADMASRFISAGISARVALADTWSAAHALARFRARSTLIVEPGDSTEAMQSLSITALRLPIQIVRDLRTLGFDTIKDLATTPRAPLALRFGPEISRRLDQALGRLSEPIVPVRNADLVEVRRPFAEPIGAAETIKRYIEKLTLELCAELERKGLGSRRLDLLCHRVDNKIEAVRVGLAQPVRDAQRLVRLLSDKVETIDPGFGIELMTLTATQVEKLSPVQSISSLVEETEADVSDLMDMLTNRLGSNRLYRFVPVASDVPERSVQKVAHDAPEADADWPASWPRPTRLLAKPEPIETIALLPDHPPVSFTWRGVRRRVRNADGPERIFGEWWKRDAELIAVRDYFQVEDDEGERYWIFRAGDGEDPGTGSHRWFLHGVFG